MKITITPALQPVIRHRLQNAIAIELAHIGKVDGGETAMDGTECSIYVYPVEGKTELDVRKALTGGFEEPWPLPPFDPEDLPVNVPEAE